MSVDSPTPESDRQAISRDHEAGAGTRPSEIWYTRCPVPTTSGVAQHFRWLHRAFEQEHITLKSIRASADRAVRNSHFDHTQANMFREGGNVPPIWARANGRDTAVVGITWIDEEQVILVRGDSDIHEPAQLKGRRLGVPLHATRLVDVARAQDLRGLLTALDLAGLARDEAIFVDIAGADSDLRENVDRQDRVHGPSVALLAGEVDAIYAKGAVGATLTARHGFRPILDINKQTDPQRRVNAGTPRPITVDRTLALEQPELVARYLAVLIQTARWAERHPAEVVAAIAAETDASVDAVIRGFGPNLHTRFAPALSEQYLGGLASQKTFLLREGFLAGDFDFDDWIVPGPLSRAHELAAQDDPVARAA